MNKEEKKLEKLKNESLKSKEIERKMKEIGKLRNEVWKS